jgi:nicotinate-nucleotide adenylyltransferase
MVELAVADEPRLMCDHRELRRSGPSYTIDSLIELNDELNDACSLTLVMGCDALLGLATWHRWEELLDWAHVLVIARPGWQLPTLGPVADWLAEHPPVSPAIVQRQRAGAVMIEEMRPLPISATEIRDLLREGRSARYLLPEGVLRYIERCELYR